MLGNWLPASSTHQHSGNFGDLCESHCMGKNLHSKTSSQSFVSMHFRHSIGYHSTFLPALSITAHCIRSIGACHLLTQSLATCLDWHILFQGCHLLEQFFSVCNSLDILNPLNAELNPICHLLALLGVHHFLHVSSIRVKSLTLRLLMSYTYIWSTHSWCF